MNKKWKVILTALITALALAMPLAAQEVPSPESNTSRATAANFTTDVDNFFHLHNWGDVEFDKSFGYAGFRNNSDSFSTGYVLDVGYARRFGGLYLSAFYEGQIAGTGAITETDTTTTTYGLNGGIYEEDRNQNTIVNDPVTPPYINNNIGVLAGIAGMGIKVGFYESLQSTDKYAGTGASAQSNITETSAGLKTLARDLTEYKKLTGDMIPYLGWGMKLNLANLVIKPEVSIGLGIHAEKEEYSFAGTNTTIGSGANVTANGTAVGTHTSGDSYVDNGYLSLGAALGAGVDFPVKDNRQFGLGLGYTISPKIYSRSYKSASGDEKVAGTINAVNYTQNSVTGTYTDSITGSRVTATEQSQIDHTVSPSFWYVNELSDTVALGISGGIDFGFGSSSSHAKTTNITRTSRASHNGAPGSSYARTVVATTDGANTEVSTFSVESSIDAGLSWAVKPDRFTVNAGLSVTLPKYERTSTHELPQEIGTITKTDMVFEDGSKTSTTGITNVGSPPQATEETKVEEAWTALSAAWSLGGAFSFTPNFAVDMYIHSGSGPLGGTQAFATLSLTQITYSMLFTLKY